MTVTLAWNRIDTVLLDMDGTLLDLHYDNHFWREHVPRRYAQKHRLDAETAKAQLGARYARVAGTLDWYCVDYWTRELGLDIAALTDEIGHLIAVHPHVVDFLDGVRAHGKRLALVTNAHPIVLALKMNRTRIAARFDAILSSHEFGLPKEQAGFWDRLQQAHPFDKDSTLFIDDSLPVLRAARAYGIGRVLAMKQPDSKLPERETGDFDAIRTFREIMP